MGQQGFGGSVCVVSGASSGLGRALAVELGRQGARVGLMARRADKLDEVAAEVRQAGSEALPLVADITDFAAVERGVRQAADHWGRLDLVIANAGVQHFGPPVELRPEQIHEMVSVNLLGAIWLVQAALPVMLRQGRGRIVGISSLAGFIGLPRDAIYCATKAGLHRYLEAIRVGYGGQGVGVTTVYPGFIRTPMTAHHKRPMPFLVEADAAARLILDGVRRGRSRLAFPRPTTALIRLGQLMPRGLRERILRRLARRSGMVMAPAPDATGR